MRINQELKLPKTPHDLWINNKSVQDLQDLFPVETSSVENASIVSPETCSHRHQQGWRHLQDVPVQNIVNNNNNNNSSNTNKNAITNINNNPDEVAILAASSPHQSDGNSCDDNDDDIHDYQSQHSHDDDSDDTSSGDEDSSISFSDTSPLLDVSSLDEDSSSSSEDSEDDDTDMCDEEEDDIPIDEDPDDNVDDGFEEEEDHGCSMDTSWMSISSAASADAPISVENKFQAFDLRRDRNGVILPDVLPVSVSKAKNDELTPDNVKNVVDATLREITLRVKKRSELKLDPVPRLLSKDCCIVEITTQPDIQVDIRLNPASSASSIPTSGTHVRHESTYTLCDISTSDITTKSSTRGIRNVAEISETRSSETQTVHSGSIREDRTMSKYMGLGEGVRLNNFSIINGFKAISLTDIVKTDDESAPTDTSHENETTDSIEDSSTSSSLKDGEDHSKNQIENSPKHSLEGYSLYSKENRRPNKSFPYKVCTVLDQRPCLDVSKPNSIVSSQANNKKTATDSISETIAASRCINSNSLHSHTKNISPLIKTNDITLSTKKNGKIPFPELFEVYNMETAVPHMNWTAANRINRESEWLKKRQNDREEIRKKLAMDSDNEDYVAEKAVKNEAISSLDNRLKTENNLQICFVNEAAKDTDIVPETKPVAEPEVANAEKNKKPLPKLLMNGLLFPSNLQKNNGQSNTNSQPQVVKRQRPTFFFNRPRSWHAPRVEEKMDPEEDLFTRHQKLQVQAWEALAQAKNMARMQMEIERQKKKKSPIADIVGITFPDGQNSLSRNALLDMNVAQLQVIVNDLHSQIETLNENLVKFLLERDDLHMEQDSMLVDIEDMTHNLGLKGHSQSTDSKLAINMPVSSNHKKTKNPEPIRRSQSLKKTRNFMWPLQRFSLLSRGTGRG